MYRKFPARNSQPWIEYDLWAFGSLICWTCSTWRLNYTELPIHKRHKECVERNRWEHKHDHHLRTKRSKTKNKWKFGNWRAVRVPLSEITPLTSDWSLLFSSYIRYIPVVVSIYGTETVPKNSLFTLCTRTNWCNLLEGEARLFIYLIIDNTLKLSFLRRFTHFTGEDPERQTKRD